MGVNGIYGLSGSGLDIESMVKVGMMSKKSQYDKMQQTYTKNEWTKESYLELYNKIQDYNLNTLSNYKRTAYMNARTATSSDSKIKVTATSSAPTQSHTIEVNKTANYAYLVGTTKLNEGNTGESSTKISDIKQNTETSESPNWESISFSNGISFTINDGTTTKEVNVTKAEIDAGFSYYNLVTRINSEGDKTNINAYYDGTQDTFSFYNLKTGSKNTLTLTANNDATAALFNKMGLKDYNTDANHLDSTPVIMFNSEVASATSTGTDAEVWVDKVKLTNLDSNTWTDKGVTYDFSNVTGNVKANVTVSQDVEKIVENVKGFVESYNEILDTLYTKYRETPNSSYKPLTEAQKAEMTEEQIKKWEEKAKSGLLYHDQTLRKIIDKMRSAISDTVGGVADGDKYNNAYSIGISTKGLYGQLQLDETKLRDALSDDPDSVYKVFATLDSATDATDSKNGIAQRLGGIMSNATESISKISGKSADNSDDSKLSVLLRNLQTRMSNFQTMMNAFEARLYKKYDAMESSLAMLGTQLNYVTGAFGGS